MSTTTWTRRLKSWKPSAPVTVPEVPVEALVEGLAPPGWLVVLAQELAEAADPVDRLAAVGLIVRLAAGESSAPAVAMARILAGAPTPAQQAAPWVRGLPPRTLTVCKTLIVERAGVLADASAGVAVLLAESALGGVDAARLVCRERDLLESAVWVLEAAECGTVARAALEGADRVALEHLSAIDFAGDLRDALLSSVAWQEPEAWWGASPW